MGTGHTSLEVSLVIDRPRPRATRPALRAATALTDARHGTYVPGTHAATILFGMGFDLDAVARALVTEIGMTEAEAVGAATAAASERLVTT